ncbi:ABC transporter permease [Rhodococcus sp. NPDC055024]
MTDSMTRTEPHGARPQGNLVVETAKRILAGRAAVTLVLLVALVIVFSATTDHFLTANNIKAVLAGASIIWVLSLGTTFMMVLGYFDLSIGSMLTLCGVLLGYLAVNSGFGIGLSIVLTLLISVVLGGFVIGGLVGRFDVSFLVVTLGALWLYLGFANLISGMKTQTISSEFLASLMYGSVGFVPTPVIIMAGTFVIAWIVLNRTLFGRDVFAIGGNLEGARVAGVRVERTIMVVFGISAGSAAAAGIMQAAQIQAASPLVGEDALFAAIAAVLLGGASLKGGVGTVTGTAIGVLFLAVLSNGLGYWGVQSYWETIVTGGIVIVAGIAEMLSRRKA